MFAPSQLSLDRRHFMSGALATLLPASALAQAGLSGPKLLDPAMLSARTPTARSLRVLGNPVSYLLEGREDQPLIVYFHGYQKGYAAVLPREYHLLREGYRLLVPNRPGYDGTSINHGRSVYDAATMVGHLFNERSLNLPRRVVVVGTSGGAPAALRFADLYPNRVSALILQAGVTQRWTEADYVPEIYRELFTAIRPIGSESRKQRFIGEIGRKTQQLGTAILRAVGGPAIGHVQIPSRIDLETLGTPEGRKFIADLTAIDPAFPAFLLQLFGNNSNANRPGEANDVAQVFLGSRDYFERGDIRCPTLILHDPRDPFVPFAHAKHAERHIPNAQVVPIDTVGHFIWLGDGAKKMHEERAKFLRDHRTS